MIEARNLSKVYWDAGRPLEIFHGVNFTVEDGGTLAVVGPSGCGKTTLLNILSGLDRASSGEAVVDGQVLAQLPEKALAAFRGRHIGLVFQNYHLLPEFSALENVMLPGLMLGGAGRAELRARAERLLAEVGLSERRSHFPSELSGGECQRVAIARALMNDPKILFCDEPTGNLDRQRAGEITELLKEIIRRGNKTAVIVTHDERAAGIADRVIDAGQGPWHEARRLEVVPVTKAAANG